jgi:hypothetical protein
LAVKAALLLGLFGGTARALTPAAEFTVRGDPHILLVGDPGLGKSQLLNAVAGVAPRYFRPFDQINMKRLNPKCRLDWCFIEFIDRYG